MNDKAMREALWRLFPRTILYWRQLWREHNIPEVEAQIRQAMAQDYHLILAEYRSLTRFSEEPVVQESVKRTGT